VLPENAIEMRAQRVAGRLGKHRAAVAVALPLADEDLVPAEVDVLDPQAARFEDAETGAVHQRGHQARRAIHALEDQADLVGRQNDGKAGGPLRPDDLVEPGEVDAEHVAVQEQQGRQGLVLGRCRHAPVDGEVGEEGGHFRRTQETYASSVRGE